MPRMACCRAEDCWKWLDIAEKGWKIWKLLESVEKGWELLEWIKMAKKAQ